MYNDYTLIVYGCGKNFFPYIERLDRFLKIDYFCDGNHLLWGRRILNDNRVCLMPKELNTIKNPFVLLTLDPKFPTQNYTLLSKL